MGKTIVEVKSSSPGLTAYNFGSMPFDTYNLLNAVNILRSPVNIFYEQGNPVRTLTI